MATTRFSLTVGKLFAHAMRCYLRNFLPFTLLSALVLSPWIAFELLINKQEALVEGIRDEDLFHAFWPQVASFVLLTGLSFCVNGALAHSSVQHLRGQSIPLAESFRQGLLSLARIFTTSLLVGLRVVGYMLLLYVPGIIETVRLSVAIPVAVMEGKGARDSIQRSIRLTDGSRWAIFGAWILLGILSAVLLGVAVAVLVAMDPEMNPDSPAFTITMQLLMTPLWACTAATAYFQLRTGKESVDTQEVAAVFD